MVEGLAVAEQRFTANGTPRYILRYLYDESNSPIGFGTYYPTASSPYWQYYYFGKNLQGDIVALYRCDYKSSDRSYYQTLVATYTYDPWGAPTGIYDANGNALSQNSYTPAAYNPFRYRGYRYDGDTRLYYLQSRYYDPAIGRFINADGYASTGQGNIGYNMFAYSNNSPVNFNDATGDMPTWVYKYFGTAWNYYSFICNYGDSDVPYYGPPNGYAKSPNGAKERWYGNDGKPAIDKHNTDHGNPKKHPDVPHGHDWGMDENGNWRPGEGYPWDESKDNNAKAEIVEKVVGGAFLAYTVIKWIVAISTAGPTGGASLAGAAAMP